MAVLARLQGEVQQGVIIPGGGPLIGQEYFRIRDREEKIWYWWISYDLAANWSHAPEFPFDQPVRFYILPYWIKIADSEGSVFYLFPEVDGSPTVRGVQPGIGEGITGAPALRVRGGRAKYRYTIVGGDLDVMAT